MIEGDQPEHGLTAVVNQHGALVLSPIQYQQETILWVRNELNSETARCRVVWVGPADSSGAYKLGIEFIDQASKFWGDLYGEAVSGSVHSAGVGGLNG
jgi:hypothetical protein